MSHVNSAEKRDHPIRAGIFNSAADARRAVNELLVAVESHAPDAGDRLLIAERILERAGAESEPVALVEG